MLLNLFCRSWKHVPIAFSRAKSNHLSLFRQPLHKECLFYSQNIALYYQRVQPISARIYQNLMQSAKHSQTPDQHKPHPPVNHPNPPQAHLPPPPPPPRPPPVQNKSSMNSHHNNSGGGGFRQKWLLEQLCAGILLFLIPAVLLGENKELEMTTMLILCYHTSHGLFSVIGDYLQPEVVGEAAPLFAKALVVLITVASLVGCYKLIYDDIGVGNTIRNFWAIKGNSD